MNRLVIDGCTYDKGELRADEFALVAIKAERWTIDDVEYELHYNPREEWTLYIEDDDMSVHDRSPQFYDLSDLVSYLTGLFIPYSAT